MKNILLALCLAAGLSACSTTCKTCNQNRNQPPAPAVALAPAPQPAPVQVATPVQVRQQAPAAYAYTVSEPVEVIYKNTTYRTVYEPKTYSSTAYVKKPYTCAQGNLCKQGAVKAQNQQVRVVTPAVAADPAPIAEDEVK